MELVKVGEIHWLDLVRKKKKGMIPYVDPPWFGIDPFPTTILPFISQKRKEKVEVKPQRKTRKTSYLTGSIGHVHRIAVNCNDLPKLLLNPSFALCHLLFLSIDFHHQNHSIIFWLPISAIIIFKSPHTQKSARHPLLGNFLLYTYSQSINGFLNNPLPFV